MSAQTTFVVLTPPGRAAIASLRLEGPAAAGLVERFFSPAGRRRLAAAANGDVLYGRWGGDGGEELVVGRQAADAWEIHCHGGRAAVERIAGELAAAGAIEAGWRAWIDAAEGDAIRAAARVQLAEARTERTAAILLDQYHGALRRAIDEVNTAIDYGESEKAIAHLETLLARAPLGRHLVTPWQVVLAGKPNVGKSSLMNRLMGYERAIVYDRPGTTRDLVTARTALDGWPVRLTDTAGLHRTGQAIEAEGVRRAERALAEADVALFVYDVSAPESRDDQLLRHGGQNMILVGNKCDLVGTSGQAGGETVLVSARTGEGIGGLIDAIVHCIVPQPPPEGAAVPFTEEQVEMLKGVLRRLK